MLREVLKKLRDGEVLVVEWYDDGIEHTLIRFNSGVWEKQELNCTSSYWLGLGTCGCNSHPTYIEHEISREEAMSLIKRYVARLQQEEQRRQQEIEYLDALIDSIED